jgi:hypothetical protein
MNAVRKHDENTNLLNKIFHNKAPYLLTVATAFFVYQLYFFLNSFDATFGIYQEVQSILTQSGGSFTAVIWLFSEFVGEIGLILRFAGSIFFLCFSAVFLIRKKVIFSYLRKGIFLEGIQYLFILPFMVLWLSPPVSIQSFEITASFLLQIILITPLFILLYTRLRQPQNNQEGIIKIGALAIISYVFAMWIKHLFFNLYVLPIDFGNPALAIGFLNSALTILISALILVFAYMPLFRGNGIRFHSKATVAGFMVFGVYFVVFFVVSIFNGTYLSFLKLTELWALSFIVTTLGYLIHRARVKSNRLKNVS